MLLHYIGKLEIQIFCRYSANVEESAFLIASNFVMHPQILIFTVFKIASLSILIANKIFHCNCSFTYLLAINLLHQKFITADGTSLQYSAMRTRF